MITEDFFNELKRKQVNEGLSLRQLSRYVEEKTGEVIAKSTLGDWLNGGYEKRKSKTVEERYVSDQFQIDKNLVTARAQATYFRDLYYKVVKESSLSDRLVEVAKKVTLALPPVKVEYTYSKITKTNTPQSIVAPLSDTHIGETVNLEEMSGLNSYNIDIFNKRLRGWAEQVYNLTSLRRTFAEIPDLYVPFLGDMISGDIHLELIKTNADNVMGQMIRGANLISQALMYLAPHYQNIYVPCVDGNHDRMTLKPSAKERYVSWGYLMSQWTAAFCKNQKNIHFSIPKSFLNVFNVAGKNILIMHGDSVKAWNGIPFYGLVRAIGQLRQVFQFRRGLEEEIQKAISSKANEQDVLGIVTGYFDSVMVGHFHTNSELDIGTGALFVCPCMKGGDEYSYGKLHAISVPSQILTTWHPKWGYISKELIYLSHYDKSENKFVDSLSEVWAENIR